MLEKEYAEKKTNALGILFEIISVKCYSWAIKFISNEVDYGSFYGYLSNYTTFYILRVLYIWEFGDKNDECKKRNYNFWSSYTITAYGIICNCSTTST